MNTVDLVVLGVILASAMLAFARGFLLEVLSLVGIWRRGAGNLVRHAVGTTPR